MAISSDTQNSDSPANTSPPPPPPPKPLQVMSGGASGDTKKPRLEAHEMQIVPVTTNTPFELPKGWSVEVRPRGRKSAVQMSDKYYYEPGSGRQFRSLLSIKRHLNGEEEILPIKKKQSNSVVPHQNSGSFKRVVYGGKFLRPDELEEAHHRNLDDIVPTTVQPKGASLIPDGWIVEEIPRKRCSVSDRYFIEPITGQRFRSVPEVQRYLAEEKRKSKCRALAFSNHARAPRSRSTRKKNISAKMPKDSILDLTHPPEKVNWVFSGDGKDNWSPVLEECVLPDYVKKQWAETFLLGMNKWKQRVPQLTITANKLGSDA